MQTKLSVYCDKIIEAGWLAAVIVTPLFFNVYSSRVFEPDKLTTLRSIALVMVLAWLVKLLDTATWSTSPAPARNPTRGRGNPSNLPDRHSVLGFAQTTAVGGELPAIGSWAASLSDLWRRARQVPLVLPTLLLVAVYLLATMTSVAPRQSLWGSYQRLQGTYTTFSYIVIFFLTLGTLHTREQLDRVITTALLTSLPISLYGIVQHFGQDPLPWVGDVVSRVASTMGNSIFVAAYLILVVPLTVGRLIEANTAAGKDETASTKAVLGVGLSLYLILELVAWAINPTAGTLAAATTIITWLVIAVLLHKPVIPFLRVSAYSVLLSAQLMCIFFTQSRGPWLGLMAGLFFFGLLWALAQRMRPVAIGLIGLAALLGGLLVVLNLPNSPLEFAREMPYIGRLGRVFETEGKTTGRVRVLIWQGAVKLITADPVRMLIGYGPETMHVAYNPYYPPELGQIEARNASPDRSHNETFDALVTTGVIGFVVYLFLFTSVFYFGLKWMGLIRNIRQRNTFIALWLGGGAVSSLGFILVEGSWKYFGVGLPAGMIIGLFVYLTGFSILVRSEHDEALPPLRLILVALLSAIVAHFVEIHFGIAIAATRTYFWVYAALLVLAGYLYRQRPALVEAEANGAGLKPAPGGDRPAGGSQSPSSTARGKRRRSRRSETRPAVTARRSGASSGSAAVYRSLVVLSLVVTLILITMIYDFFAPQIDLAKNPIMLWLIGFTWLFAGVLIVGETRPPGEEGNLAGWFIGLTIYAGVSIVGAGLFAAVHGASLSPTSDLANILVPYYTFLFLAIVTIAGVLLWHESLPQPAVAGMRSMAYPVLAVVALVVLFSTNVQVVQADIYYKQAWVGFHQKGDYDTAIALYNKALQLQPEQDFYLLFLGKAMLEKGEQLKDPGQQDALFERARQVLEEARRLNPLNTDHTANLARMYQIWGNVASDPARRQELLNQSLAYYDQATRLSPNNAQLWDEWGRTAAMLGDYDQALAKYQHSLALDSTFEQTYLQLGDLYRTQQKWPEAVDAYQKALAQNPKSVQAHSALGFVYSQMGQLEDAVRENQAVVTLAPNDVASHRNLALLYQQLGRWDEALTEARTALALTPEDKDLQAFVQQLEQRK
jgi:tetratricopeptide (TPR) repeat protein/O-antigen ligase